MKKQTLNLVKEGFIKDEFSSRFKGLKKDEFEELDTNIIEKIVDEELSEETNKQFLRTGYPEPLKKYRLIYESPNMSIEEVYFWMLGHLKQDMGFPEVDKITDVFSASESSAMWGNIQQRMSIQQDRATQSLIGINKLIKEGLFPLVRELRILEERINVYNKWKDSHSADVTLKGWFIDLVEGGSKNPTSVYGLAQTVGFTILPDLFFNTHITKLDEIDEKIKRMEYNESIKNVLKRKLTQYVVWVNKTDNEIRNRFSFTLKTLKQNHASIKINISWLKPYLRNIKRLRMHKKHTDSAELISSFEGSLTEIEFLAKKKLGSHYAVVLINFNYRTMPSLSYQAEGYQRGPIHVGRVDVRMRAYAWNKKQIKQYKQLRENEDTELLGYVDSSLPDAINALSGDVERYLEMSDLNFKELNKHLRTEKTSEISNRKNLPINPNSVLEPFTALFSGFKELFIPDISFSKKQQPKKIKSDSSHAKKEALGALWQVFKNYKKAHGLVSW